MPNTVIQQYLKERKNLWLKSKIKSSSTEEQVAEFNQTAEHNFSPQVWITNAAKRAKQLSIVSHPSKFNHSSAKTSPVIAQCSINNDGLLRSGNVKTELDVVGNAAALDVYRFLHLELSDGQTILKHIEQSTELIKKELDGIEKFGQLREDFLAIQKTDNKTSTSDLVKQVYFPVEDDYHLLSLMTASGLSVNFKNRIDNLFYSEESKQARDAKKANQFSETGFSNIHERTLIGYGGTKPQNISYLNSKNGGVSYLLHSAPPKLHKRKVKLPTKSFFTQTLSPIYFADDFLYFHKILTKDKRNNVDIRDKRDDVILSILFHISNFLKGVRKYPIGWSNSKHYIHLPAWQKLWLDNQYLDNRKENDEYLIEVNKRCAKWFIESYGYVIGYHKLDFDDKDLKYVIKTVTNDIRKVLR